MPQISELFSTFLSSGGHFNTLVESLLDAMSRHERSLFVDSHEGEQCNGFRPRKWRSQGLCFELRIPCLLYTSPSPRDKRQSRMPSSA